MDQEGLLAIIGWRPGGKGTHQVSTFIWASPTENASHGNATEKISNILLEFPKELPIPIAVGTAQMVSKSKRISQCVSA
jgi:hypothetical protein